jgi:hypothetical protein
MAPEPQKQQFWSGRKGQLKIPMGMQPKKAVLNTGFLESPDPKDPEIEPGTYGKRRCAGRSA